ncbi:fatty acid-binding protein, liver-like [Chiloscyllium punctatum]|uniref:fatty acid-binding protein, liver-like n=1 Tax=Chiloscyllium punctatum TaxID=137246 RepID=UPI003B635163
MHVIRFSSCWFSRDFTADDGIPNELIGKEKDLKSITEIVQNGNDSKITIAPGTNVIHNEFIIGQETEFATMTGNKIKDQKQHSFLPDTNNC